MHLKQNDTKREKSDKNKSKYTDTNIHQLVTRAKSIPLSSRILQPMVGPILKIYNIALIAIALQYTTD
jgi:hypothetical protein